MTRLRNLLPLAVFLSCIASAMEFTPGSECAAYCLDDSNGDTLDAKDSTTNTTDIVCHDNEYSTKSAGIKYKNCQECLQKSDYVKGSEADTHWFMYNLQYSLSTCLFDTPNKIPGLENSPCIIDYACGPLQDPMASTLNSSSQSNTWAFCDQKKEFFTNQWRFESCVKCLQSTDDQTYLANFVIALGAGCDQRPEPGTIVGLTNTIFSSSAINGTAPAEDIRSRPAGAGTSTLTTGAIVGIAVGAGLLLLGGLALFCVYWRRQKKYEATEKQGGDFFPGGAPAGPGTYTPDPYLPPQGAQMTNSLRHMSDGSGAGGAGGLAGYNHKKGVSVSSAEYRNHHDDVELQQHSNYNFDPRSTNRGPNGALPSHPAYIPRAASRASEPQVAITEPVLQPQLPTPPLPTQQQQHQQRHRASKSTTAIDTRPTHQYNPSTSSSPQPPLPPPPPRGHKPKVPSLVLPSLSRVRGPKKYSPPLVSSRSGTPSSMEREREQADHHVATAMQISRPVTSNDGRFQDRPLQGGTVLATEGVAVVDRPGQGGKWNEVPMKSGKSALYGY